MWTPAVVSSRTRSRGCLALIALWLLAASSSGAQETVQTGVRMDTGLLTFFTGERRSAVVTVAEVGGLGVTSTVRVIFYDASDRVLLRDEQTLQRGHPARFELPLGMPERAVQVRASIRIVGAAGRYSAPIMVLEDVDAGTLTIEPRISCAPPSGRQGPVLPLCTDTHNSTIGL